MLSTLKYGDNSRIVRIYTDEFGLLSFLLNSTGGKRAIVRSSMLLPLSMLEIVHTHKGEGKLDRIKEARMEFTYSAIPYDPIRNALALFLAELFGKVLRSEEANQRKFDFIQAACLALDTLEIVPPAFHLAVWAKLTLFLGFGPTVGNEEYFDLHEGMFVSEPPLLHAYLQPKLSDALREVLEWDFESPLQIHKTHRNELLEALKKYMDIHLDGFGGFKSLEVLHDLFL